ncbi:hypothetical protein [Rhizobium sp. G21]|uniref:hypothetical protein n=1 Tax=Rhizobium sp. G21 TaxID=2758439 RepID=UPI001600CA0D|nr:hypothetical protein [Rhizobium sp. G21]MBB1249182.1 hypothetical protein [Rhizobium sp. G21]
MTGDHDKHSAEPIVNGASDRDAHQRRSGGSANDPHGGYEQETSSVASGSDPERLDELARVNFQAGRDKAGHRSAPDLRGGDQPILRSDGEVRFEGEEKVRDQDAGNKT